MTISPREIASSAASIRRLAHIETFSTATHQVAVVRNLESAEAISHLGTYLVGAGFMRAVSVDLRITQAFLQISSDAAAKIRQAVHQRIGADNGIDESFRVTERDPWIAEGVGHLLLWLSRRTETLAVRGRLAALMTLHVHPKESGLDLVALFVDQPALGVTVGEAKASRDNATAQVREAAGFFAQMDTDPLREIHLRDGVQLLRTALRPELDDLVTPALWEQNRCYLGVVAYGENCSTFVPQRARSSYRSLQPGANGVRLVCLCLRDYAGFFNAVSDAIRANV